VEKEGNNFPSIQEATPIAMLDPSTNVIRVIGEVTDETEAEVVTTQEDEITVEENKEKFSVHTEGGAQVGKQRRVANVGDEGLAGNRSNNEQRDNCG
jgi:hypothetical protein